MLPIIVNGWWSGFGISGANTGSAFSFGNLPASGVAATASTGANTLATTSTPASSAPGYVFTSCVRREWSRIDHVLCKENCQPFKDSIAKILCLSWIIFYKFKNLYLSYLTISWCVWFLCLHRAAGALTTPTRTPKPPSEIVGKTVEEVDKILDRHFSFHIPCRVCQSHYTVMNCNWFCLWGCLSYSVALNLLWFKWIEVCKVKSQWGVAVSRHVMY